MRSLTVWAAWGLVAGLAACNPTFNWREVPVAATGLVALLPCKPDQGSRVVPLGGQPVALHMMGCDTGGATFAVAHAEIADAAQAAEVLAQWRRATLANMHAAASQDAPFMPRGGAVLPPSVRIVASGQRADGSAVTAHAVWFGRPRGSGAQLFHAVVYADKPNPELADTFFSGLQFQ
ncbi:MAG: hypothetical protein ACRECD_10785 [Burkholderiaceae bacterium]